MSDQKNTISKQEPGFVKADCLIFLKKHCRWYRIYSVANYASWWIVSLSIIVLSTATSLMLAIGLEKHSEEIKYIVITLPIIVSMLSSALIQFGMKQTSELREMGKIEIEELMCEADQISDTNSDNDKKLSLQLKRRAIRIAKRQASRHFALLLDASDRKVGDPDGDDDSPAGADNSAKGAQKPR